MGNYLDILTATFMLRKLKPWHTNTGKREVSTPKIYFTDTGILHHLLGISDEYSLITNPVVRSSWEGFAIEQIIRALDVPKEKCYFWSIHSGAELDLLIELKNNKKNRFRI